MEKIIFQDLKSLIGVFSISSHQRMILSHSTVKEFIWRGPEGFYTYLLVIFEFQKKYLSKHEGFSKLTNQLKELVESIPKKDFEQQIINKEVHKEVLFNALNILGKFEQQIIQYYSLNTLFQFTNITFNSDILFSNIADVFEKETWDFIPESAQYDIIEGGEALLFNLPTCSSFMFMRALEDCIRKLCDKLETKKQNITFGVAINIVVDGRENFDINQKVFERQIDFLKYIKDEYRNPSAHPDKTFSQKEAEQLFQVINVAIDKLRFLYCKIK